MNTARLPRAVVLDIEGTTGSLSHVHDVLFPFARQRLGPWLRDHVGTPAGRAVLSGVRTAVGIPALSLDDVVTVLEGWSDQDRKEPSLKALQAAIWAEGYAGGRLHGHVYDEVPTVLRQLHQAGVDCFIYSSGAVQAQRDWFAHSNHGDLTPLLKGYFDLETGGGKRLPASYQAISQAIGVPPGLTVFASDVAEELHAASAAGWQTLGVRRPGDARGPQVAGHPTAGDFRTLLTAQAGEPGYEPAGRAAR
jgi:enolase-phosphatase E1